MLRAFVAAVAFLGAPLAAQQPVVRDTAVRDTTAVAMGADSARAPGDTVIRPSPNQALGVDAEIRAALFDLHEDEALNAAGRLDYLRNSSGAVPASASAGLRGRSDLLFLLAESYYRLNMSEPFRSTVESLRGAGAPPRYIGVVQPQLLLEAYRVGDYERAIRLADTTASAPASRSLAAFVGGLAAYQLRRYPQARASFAVAQQGGEPYATLARYMDALTQLRTDTAQIAPTLQALESVASQASGAIADQIRLTAAQLAYEADQFQQAAQLAERVSSTSGVAAQALLTSAWALYKADQIEAAYQAFQEFGRRFPQLPEQEESLLMAGQALLQLGRTAEAAQLFRTIADSASAEVDVLSRRGAMNELARELVATRSAGLLFFDAASGKSISLGNGSGAEWSVIAGAFADTTLAPMAPATIDVLSLDQLVMRLDSAARSGSDTAMRAPTMLPRRVLFTPVSATSNRADFMRRSQALHAADVEVALARCRLEEALTSLAMRIRMLEQLKVELDREGRAFEQTSATLIAAQDSLRRLNISLEEAATEIRQLFSAQANVTRMLAAENRQQIDSVRTTMAGALGPTETTVLGLEAETAQLYGQTAEAIERGLDGAISRHPVFALRDTIMARADSIRQLLGSTTQLVQSTIQAIDQELARLRASEPEQIRALRSTLASAEQRQSAAATQLVSVVNSELEARASELLADLRRDVEAAEFGTASAAFFQAIDAAGRTGTPTRSDGPAAASAGRAAAAGPSLANPKKE